MRVTCCPVQAPEPTFSFLEVARGSHLHRWEVLSVPWDRRSWDTGLPYFMATAKGCVYMQACSLPPAAKWEMPEAQTARQQGQDWQDHSRESHSHAQKQRHLNPRRAHGSHYLEPTGHSFKEPSVPKLNTSRYHQQQGGTEMLCRDLSLPAGPLWPAQHWVR